MPRGMKELGLLTGETASPKHRIKHGVQRNELVGLLQIYGCRDLSSVIVYF